MQSWLQSILIHGLTRSYIDCLLWATPEYSKGSYSSSNKVKDFDRLLNYDLRNIIFMKNGNKHEIRLESLVFPCVYSVTGY